MFALDELCIRSKESKLCESTFPGSGQAGQIMSVLWDLGIGIALTLSLSLFARMLVFTVIVRLLVFKSTAELEKRIERDQVKMLQTLCSY